MTKREFWKLCGEYLIDPRLALCDDEILEALKQDYDIKVEALLATYSPRNRKTIESQF
jgi:hypothetical protein